jgi:hypothetical protein
MFQVSLVFQAPTKWFWLKSSRGVDVIVSSERVRTLQCNRRRGDSSNSFEVLEAGSSYAVFKVDGVQLTWESLATVKKKKKQKKTKPASKKAADITAKADSVDINGITFEIVDADEEILDEQPKKTQEFIAQYAGEPCTFSVTKLKKAAEKRHILKGSKLTAAEAVQISIARRPHTLENTVFSAPNNWLLAKTAIGNFIISSEKVHTMQCTQHFASFKVRDFGKCYAVFTASGSHLMARESLATARMVNLCDVLNSWKAVLSLNGYSTIVDIDLVDDKAKTAIPGRSVSFKKSIDVPKITAQSHENVNGQKKCKEHSRILDISLELSPQTTGRRVGQLLIGKYDGVPCTFYETRLPVKALEQHIYQDVVEELIGRSKPESGLVFKAPKKWFKLSTRGADRITSSERVQCVRIVVFSVGNNVRVTLDEIGSCFAIFTTDGNLLREESLATSSAAAGTLCTAYATDSRRLKTGQCDICVGVKSRVGADVSVLEAPIRMSHWQWSLEKGKKLKVCVGQETDPGRHWGYVIGLKGITTWNK